MPGLAVYIIPLTTVSSMSESLGIMDEGYFVSRKDLLRWINNTLSVDLTQIQQLGSGAIYCQLLDAFCPGSAPLHKINWKARHEYEFIQNFKVLQTVFDRLGIAKKIEVQKLAKCKYQDNLEFIQWMKRYIELQGGCAVDYDAPGKRGHAQPDLSFSEKKLSNLAFNKQNIKKPSTSNLLNLSMMDFKKGGGFQPQTPSKQSLSSTRRSISGLYHRPSKNRVKTEPTPAEDEKIGQIKQILSKAPMDTDQQLEKIRQLLNVCQIEEEEEPDFI